MAATLSFRFLANDKGLQDGIKRSKQQLSGLEARTKQVSSSMSRAFKGLAIGGAIAGLGRYAVFAAKGFEKAQIASKKLGAVLESMGVEKATKRVDAYAESLQTQLYIDADLIKATQTKLATFAELNKTINITGGNFDRATVAALDLASAGFGTADGNAVQLGKALNDPIKGLGALTRNGITFTKEEKKKIETLVKSNKILKAQSIILDAIEMQVGGASAAGVSAFDKLKLSIDVVNDAVGEALLPVFENLAQFFADNGPTIAKAIKDLFDPKSKTGKVVKEFGDKMVELSDKVDDFFKQFDPKKKSSIIGFFELVKFAVDGLITSLQLANDLINLPGNAAKSGSQFGTSLRNQVLGTKPQELPSARFTGRNTTGQNNYTINVNKATINAPDIIREIQRLERQTGKKYLQ